MLPAHGDHLRWRSPMRWALSAITIFGWAAPAAAQLTTTYHGFQREGGKDVPTSAQFSVENGRVAIIMKGSRSARMLFDAKAQVLHMVSDDDKSYLDLHQGSGGG